MAAHEATSSTSGQNHGRRTHSGSRQQAQSEEEAAAADPPRFMGPSRNARRPLPPARALVVDVASASVSSSMRRCGTTRAAGALDSLDSSKDSMPAPRRELGAGPHPKGDSERAFGLRVAS